MQLKVLAASALAPLLAACGDESLAACHPGACDAPDGGADVTTDGPLADGQLPVDGGSDVFDAAPACDLTKDPKDSSACLTDSVGVFVDASKSDTNSGTKASPVATLAKGLAIAKMKGLARVYVCEGTYVEDVSLSQATSIYGGWKCNDWSYSGNKASVGKTSLAVRVDSVASAIVLADLNITAASATTAGGSSVGVLVNASSDVTMLRDAVKAGAGKDGADAMQKAQAAKAADGLSSMSNAGGAQCKNTCQDGDSIGGAGGDVGSNNAVAGGPSYGGAYPLNGGAGAVATTCNLGGAGGTGAPPTTTGTDQPGAAVYGTLTTTWSPAAGTAGTSGVRGQGGGGGGSRAGGGGGGGCGGCGGLGGDPGGGGGGSFGVVSIASSVKFLSSSVSTGVGGHGGAGSVGQLGQLPGSGGGGYNGSPPVGCGGGDGSQGSKGGAGGGGAGGLSVGVFFKGTAPTIDNATQTAISVGASGAGGVGPASNSGVSGTAAPTLECKGPLCN